MIARFVNKQALPQKATIKFLFCANDIKGLQKDTTLGMIKNAQDKGIESYICQNKDLFLETKDGKTTSKGNVQKITLHDDYETVEKFYKLEEKKSVSLTDFNAISQRTDPPVDQSYQYTAFILQKAFDAGVIMVNPPLSLLVDNEKILATKFSQFIPPAVFTADAKIIEDFAAQHKKIILKPIDGFGGKNIFISHPTDPNLNVLVENLSDNGKLQIIAQKFLPEIKDGDKRILIIHGEVFPQCMARIPHGTDHRGNLSAGGDRKIFPLTQKDYEIASTVAEYLKANNIALAGIDVIGEHLTEINITSPGTLKALGRSCVKGEKTPMDMLIDGLIKKIQNKKIQKKGLNHILSVLRNLVFK